MDNGVEGIKASINNRDQIITIFCGTLLGEFLPLQPICQGKTRACLPHYKFSHDWHVTFTPNHWSNEDKMKVYIIKIILPYVHCKHRELKLSSDHPELATFDVFRGQQTEDIFSLLEENNIYVVSVLANCIDCLQLMDLSINKSGKEFMQSKFRDCMPLR